MEKFSSHSSIHRNYGKIYHNPPPHNDDTLGQLELFPCAPSSRQKPQIVSTPGVSPKQRNRYRVVTGDRILGDRLTLDQALALVKKGGK